MASSGSFNTSGYGSGDWNRYLRFEWSIQSQSIANNTTTISYTLKGAGGATNNWYQSGNFKLVIDGKTVYSSATRINLKNGTVVTSGTMTLAHDSAGNRSFSASAQAGIYTVAVNCSGSGSWALTSIPRAATATSATNFNDTGNPVFKYSNPAGNAVSELKAGIFNTAGSTAYAAYRDVPKTGSSYTFNLTTAERNALLAACPNSKTMQVRFYIRTVIGGNSYLNYATATMTVVDGNPTFSAAYLDTNSTTTGVTGNNQQIVRSKSSLRINVTSLSAKKSATISTVKCVLNGTTYNGTISGSSCTFNIGAVNSASNVTATITTTDSRGFATSRSLTITVLDWVQPSAIVTMERENNFYTPTTITVDGSISSVNNKNTMTIKMRYKKQSEAWSQQTWYTMQDNVPQTFSLDKDFVWDVQVQITDKFATTTYNLALPRGLPIVYYDRVKSSTGFNCFPQDEGSVEVNGFNIIPSIMTRSLSEAITNLAVNTYTKIPFDLSNSTGSKLTATNDGGIRIGSGVSKVLVSALLSYDTTNATSSKHMRIVKNSYTQNNTLAWSWQTLVASQPANIEIVPVLANVQEGDVIYAMYYNGSSADKIGGNTYGCRTSLTVQVVG